MKDSNDDIEKNRQRYNLLVHVTWRQTDAEPVEWRPFGGDLLAHQGLFEVLLTARVADDELVEKYQRQRLVQGGRCRVHIVRTWNEQSEEETNARYLTNEKASLAVGHFLDGEI